MLNDETHKLKALVVKSNEVETRIRNLQTIKQELDIDAILNGEPQPDTNEVELNALKQQLNLLKQAIEQQAKVVAQEKANHVKEVRNKYWDEHCKHAKKAVILLKQFAAVVQKDNDLCREMSEEGVSINSPLFLFSGCNLSQVVQNYELRLMGEKLL